MTLLTELQTLVHWRKQLILKSVGLSYGAWEMYVWRWPAIDMALLAELSKGMQQLPEIIFRHRMIDSKCFGFVRRTAVGAK
jgi:hypothetical protein